MATTRTPIKSFRVLLSWAAKLKVLPRKVHFQHTSYKCLATKLWNNVVKWLLLSQRTGVVFKGCPHLKMLAAWKMCLLLRFFLWNFAETQGGMKCLTHLVWNLMSNYYNVAVSFAQLLNIKGWKSQFHHQTCQEFCCQKDIGKYYSVQVEKSVSRSRMIVRKWNLE